MTRTRSRRPPQSSSVAVELHEAVRQRDDTIEMLSESIVDLERSMLDPGWTRLAAAAHLEFSDEGLRRIREICRIFSIAHPLAKRGLSLRAAYIHGQGVEIAARANGRRQRPGEQDVNSVVQDFMSDAGNQRAMFSAKARTQLERSGFGAEGELFVALFTKPVSGKVQVRMILADQVAEVISNPDDDSEPWYYRRRWAQTTVDPATGSTVTQQMERLYPALGYRPTGRPKRFGTVPIAWDSPVLHVMVNEPLGWKRGIPDTYAAVDWARAYKEFLEDWARLVKSLSRYAWRLTAKGQNAAQARRVLAAAPNVDPVTGKPLGAGATALTPMDASLEAIPKSGATIDSDSGRPLAMMIAAALGVPVTMLLADPGQTGARATAKTLDQPTELEMMGRQGVWSDIFRTIGQYVITESVRAPKGLLKGTIRVDPDTGREVVALAGDTETTIDVTWPDLDDIDPATLIEAIAKAADTGVIKPEVVLRLLLTTLGLRNVDELVEECLDDEGNFKWPETGGASTVAALGQQAADAARNGQDPARSGTGSMAPDGEPADQPVDQGAA